MSARRAVVSRALFVLACLAGLAPIFLPTRDYAPALLFVCCMLFAASYLAGLQRADLSEAIRGANLSWPLVRRLASPLLAIVGCLLGLALLYLPQGSHSVALMAGCCVCLAASYILTLFPD